MMVYTKNLILVCTGRDTTKAASLGMPVLQLCLGISQSGALQRLKVSAVQRHCLLGVTDPPLNRRLLAAFDEALYDADIPLYVPLECGRTLSHAILTVSTAISGGSLTEYISSLQGIYGAARIAAFLQPVSQDFTLPSPTPNGVSLSSAARAALLAQTGAQPFFSRELCAKYFTYMNADGQAHFVLYDDNSTLAAKLAQLAGCGVQNVFALFPDAAGLLKPQA